MEVPKCGDKRHTRAVVVRAGLYGAPGRRRQRWLCKPPNGKPHRFTEPLPRLIADAAPHRCETCSTVLEPWEGQPAPRLYGFSARQIARALTEVARGGSYRGASAAARTRAGRELDTRPGRTARGGLTPSPNQHGQLVSDWVETYAPALWAAHAPASWPDRLVLDDARFVVRTTRNQVTVQQDFYVFAALGYDRRGRPYVAAIEASPRRTEHAWAAFLRRLPGQPSLVVTDGGTPGKAAAKVFPAGTEIRRCEWHLLKGIVEHLPERVRKDADDPIHALLRQAQRSPIGWDQARDALERRGAKERGWLAANKVAAKIDPIVRAQIATRTTIGPNSTGPVEEFLRGLRQTLGPRSQRLTNRTRANALLLLLAAQRNGWVDETRWANIIQDRLLASEGVAPLQRQHTDPAGSPSLWH